MALDQLLVDEADDIVVEVAQALRWRHLGRREISACPANTGENELYLAGFTLYKRVVRVRSRPMLIVQERSAKLTLVCDEY